MVAPQKRTLCELFRAGVAEFSRDIVFSFVGEEPYTYRQVEQQVHQLVQSLRQRGIRPGDRIALLGDNSPSWCIAYLAIVSMGAGLRSSGWWWSSSGGGLDSPRRFAPAD